MIALLLRMLPQDKKAPTLRGQIAILEDLGIKPAEIARIIGRSSNYVRVELTAIRKGQKRVKEME